MSGLITKTHPDNPFGAFKSDCIVHQKLCWRLFDGLLGLHMHHLLVAASVRHGSICHMFLLDRDHVFCMI